MQKLFEAALGITSPWYVKKIDFGTGSVEFEGLKFSGFYMYSL